MNRLKIIGLCAFTCLTCLTGCHKQAPEQKEDVIQQSVQPQNPETENMDADPTYRTGEGFKPPKDSHIDRRGNIVDAEGNTFNAKGEWQVPEGGRVDSQGRILDKDGNVMGGGATVGSVG